MAEDRITAFINDMASKYIPGRRDGSDVLELFTADTGNTYRVCLTPQACETNVPEDKAYSVYIETTSDTFMLLLSGKMKPLTALMLGKVKVKGDIKMLKALPNCFRID